MEMVIVRCFQYFAFSTMCLYNLPREQQRDKNYYFHVIGDKKSLEMLTTLKQRNQSYNQE